MAENQTADIHINAIDGFSKTLGNFSNALGSIEGASKNFGSAMTSIFQGAGMAIGNFAMQGGQKLIGFVQDSLGVAVAGATGGRDSGDLDARGAYSGPSSFVMNVDGKVLGQTAIHYGAEPTRASKRRTYGGGGAGGGTRR